MVMKTVQGPEISDSDICGDCVHIIVRVIERWVGGVDLFYRFIKIVAMICML